MCPFLSQSFVIEVKIKGGSKYFIYRRYREFFNLHQLLESKYSPENPEKAGPNTCVLPTLPGERVHGPADTSRHNIQHCVTFHIARIRVCQGPTSLIHCALNSVLNLLRSDMHEEISDPGYVNSVITFFTGKINYALSNHAGLCPHKMLQ